MRLLRAIYYYGLLRGIKLWRLDWDREFVDYYRDKREGR